MRRIQRIRTVVGRLSCAVLALVGPRAGDASALQAPRFPALSADVPVGDGRAEPCLGRVGGEVFCGRFRVYENRAARTGRTVDVAFVVCVRGAPPTEFEIAR
jgi:hypothetical protein